jgi:inner membrane protein CreD
MTRRIAALSFIFICTSIAWMILGSTIFARTYSPLSGNLKEKVASTWGVAQEQYPPTASYLQEVTRVTTEETDQGRKVREIKRSEPAFLPLEASNVNVIIDLAHRQKGMLWYSTYAISFDGAYTFTNNTAEQREISFKLPFPADKAVYDDATMSIDGRPLATRSQGNAAVSSKTIAPGQTVILKVGYRSRGLDSWRYNFGGNVQQVPNFNLSMKTNFKDIDFPENTLSPTSKRERQDGDGWDLSWNYKNLVSGYNIGVTMPEKLQPGPLAGEISYFAPVSLFFFFFLIFIITTLRGINLHPMNYFFLAAAFFAFHLLLAYLVDHISIHVAFLICSVVSMLLVVSYLRLVAGMRFAAMEAGSAQLLYLVLFSYAFFFKGFTGLAITIGSILTLFVLMQMTGRIRWSEKFAQATK